MFEFLRSRKKEEPVNDGITLPDGPLTYVRAEAQSPVSVLLHFKHPDLPGHVIISMRPLTTGKARTMVYYDEHAQ
jgi:hypothetical protein